MVTNIDCLIGKVFTSVTFHEDTWDGEVIIFKNDIESYMMYHEQDCCENVYVEDITGDLFDLEGSEILVAEERSNNNDTDDGDESWTFYTIRTIYGSVDIRWHGTSNGYYSTSVKVIDTNKEY